MKLEGYVSREKIDKPNDFQQAGERYHSFSKEEQDNLIANLTSDLKDVNEQTKLLQFAISSAQTANMVCA